MQTGMQVITEISSSIFSKNMEIKKQKSKTATTGK